MRSRGMAAATLAGALLAMSTGSAGAVELGGAGPHQGADQASRARGARVRARSRGSCAAARPAWFAREAGAQAQARRGRRQDGARGRAAPGRGRHPPRQLDDLAVPVHDELHLPERRHARDRDRRPLRRREATRSRCSRSRPAGASRSWSSSGRVLLKRNAGIGSDYALVEIPPEHHYVGVPDARVVGGPCGVFTGERPAAGGALRPRRGRRHRRHSARRHGVRARRGSARGQGNRLGLGRRLDHLGRPDQRRRLRQRRPRRPSFPPSRT